MKKKENACSFTLIEMLIVIAIICVMAGMILKLMSLAKRQQEKAACVALLERVSHALNEYRAEYGEYPPVETGACIRWSWGCHPEDCRTCYTFGDAGSESGPAGDYFRTTPGDAGRMYKYGLTSYLVTRVTNNQYETTLAYRNNIDQPRDVALKQKWAPFLEGLIDGRDNWAGHGIEVTNNYVGTLQYNIYVFTITDPWGNVIRYRSDPPYTTYDLWSAGPDGKDGYNERRGGTLIGPPYDRDNIHKSGKWDE
ncbi:MAG: type II secretion system protein GspG [Kiritimatiellae bacterium]|nr:type II secretion system protein GspG [Kiritimatiellia bacterium]MDD5522257.1 type II secretion system protein GspG [Kiritimatiellia bacterium]